ncbi:isoprenoid biosynthesis glyoxalase ElbB [Bdellovibrio sp. HCB337]|uniref:isoprenoid biosynthesis glyoxalase ElbB n=1 Tax=Bdellovibrio sp. HCB337 TaxID=3394358 RepID=UPI0039A6DF96
MKKIAVVLSGCGNKDGAEITEAVSLLISLSQNGASYMCFAPNTEVPALNFLTNETLSEKRNAMIEAARIARSQVQDLKTLKVTDYDALAFVGGYGAAKVLSTWAEKGAQCTVSPEVEKSIKDFYNASKPIAAICIAPVLLAKVLGSKKVTVTLGDGKETIAEVLKTGAQHEICPVDDYVTDRETKVITTPAYMYDNAKPHEVFKGISGLAKELVEMA